MEISSQQMEILSSQQTIQSTKPQVVVTRLPCEIWILISKYLHISAHHRLRSTSLFLYKSLHPKALLYFGAFKSSFQSLPMNIAKRMRYYDGIHLDHNGAFTQEMLLFLCQNDCASALVSILKNPDPDWKIDPSVYGNYAFQSACWTGAHKVVDWLLQDPRVTPNCGFDLPFRLAASSGHLSVVARCLSDKRINPAAWGNAAIQNASENGHFHTVCLLLQDPRVDPSVFQNRALRRSARNGFGKVVQALLKDSRVDPSCKENEAIRMAILNGHDDVVSILLSDHRTWQLIKPVTFDQG